MGGGGEWRGEGGASSCCGLGSGPNPSGGRSRNCCTLTCYCHLCILPPCISFLQLLTPISAHAVSASLPTSLPPHLPLLCAGRLYACCNLGQRTQPQPSHITMVCHLNTCYGAGLGLCSVPQARTVMEPANMEQRQGGSGEQRLGRGEAGQAKGRGGRQK